MPKLMRYTYLKSIGLGGLCLAMNTYAEDISLIAPASIMISYDPFIGLSGLEEMTIDVLYSGEEPLDARLLISPDTASEFQLGEIGDPVFFEINSVFGNSDVNQFDAPIRLQPSSATQPFMLTFKVPSGQYADAGEMNMDLKIALVDNVTSELISNEKILNLVGRIPLRAQTNFAGTSSGFENGSTYALVDFGEIRGIDSRKINFQIRGNSNVDIEMSSENSGKMLNLAAPDMSPIHYTVNADGHESDLSVPLEFTRRPNRSLAGSSYPLTIKLEEMNTGVFAGEYKDIISIDVSPR